MATGSAAVSYPVPQSIRLGLCGVVILLGDILALVLAIGLAILGRATFGGDFDAFHYLRLAPIIALFIAVYALSGLYPGVTFNPVAELRQLSVSTTLVFVVISTLLFLLKSGPAYSRVVFLAGWIAALFSVPLTRALLRTILGNRHWWGVPIAVLGSPEDVNSIVAVLRGRPELGLSPVPIFASPETLAGIQQRRPGLDRAIIARPDLSQYQLAHLIESEAVHFSRVYVLPNLQGLSSEGVEVRDLGFRLALEIRRNLLLPSHQMAKAILDRSLSLGLGIAVLPLMVLIAVAIRLESRGPALFGHTRIGRRGEPFRIWKFRTMHQDGARILEEHFRRHPADRLEWARLHKLRQDPRVTRLGRFLRKTSLDELPQFWNVLRGEMSLVGPRPIVASEIDKYGDAFRLYCRVVPGLTGMWQVSGRSETDYGQRVDLDTFYVRNWSPWLDVYLLARTVKVVLRGEGAY